jgi:hypothetical protein
MHHYSHVFLDLCAWRIVLVTEYRISLDAAAPEAYRLTLPTRWKSEGPRRLRLIRRFNQPFLEAGARAVLQMEKVPGICLLQLNGQSTHPGSPDRAEYEIALDGSAARHQLILEIEPPTPEDPVTGTPEWGVIALVIRTASPRDRRPSARDDCL